MSARATTSTRLTANGVGKSICPRPFRSCLHRIRWAPIRIRSSGVPEQAARRGASRRRVGLWFLVVFLIPCATTGCSAFDRRPGPQTAPQTITVAVAPVLNLSGSRDWDVLKVTDFLASELQQFPGVTVIPINRSLATLAEQGKTVVDTPDTALWLAEELRADATVVAAITEYNPYDPPIVGLIIQLYTPASAGATRGLDAVAASRNATDFAPAGDIATAGDRPLQIQRVFNASDTRVLDEMKDYGKLREGRESPHDWQVHAKSQELFVRFSLWSAIRSMLWARAQCGTDAGLGADEADDE